MLLVGNNRNHSPEFLGMISQALRAWKSCLKFWTMIPTLLSVLVDIESAFVYGN